MGICWRKGEPNRLGSLGLFSSLCKAQGMVCGPLNVRECSRWGWKLNEQGCMGEVTKKKGQFYLPPPLPVLGGPDSGLFKSETKPAGKGYVATANS